MASYLVSDGKGRRLAMPTLVRRLPRVARILSRSLFNIVETLSTRGRVIRRAWELVYNSGRLAGQSWRTAPSSTLKLVSQDKRDERDSCLQCDYECALIIIPLSANRVAGMCCMIV